MKYKATKFFVDFEKEERWVNEMAQKGMNFTHYTFLTYHFEEGVPGEYIYRTELLKKLPKHPESRTYIKFMEENGVECVSTYIRWAFFRKKASEGPFDIYSDMESRITHYKRVAAFIVTTGIANLVIGVANFINWLFIGYPHGFNVNLYASLVSLSLGVALTVFASRYSRKIGKLKDEKLLYE